MLEKQGRERKHKGENKTKTNIQKLKWGGIISFSQL